MDRKERKEDHGRFSCMIIKDKHGYYTECGMRLNYNHLMRYCPYCGRLMSKVFKGGK